MCNAPASIAETANTPPGPLGMDPSQWRLVWEDDFDYPDAQLDENWESQNGPSGHILCSRWRENAVVKDGVLHLVNRKENRGGQEWTSGNIWTKQKFKYGFFECRYRYAEASATNNSFWLMTRWEQPNPAEGKRFEIDINEGHYPNEVNTNIHNWTDITTLPDGRKTHPSDSKSFSFGTQPGYSLPLEIPVTTRKLRLTFDGPRHHHIREFRVYGENNRTFPDVMSDTADNDLPGLVNHARDPRVKITSNGDYRDTDPPANVADGSIATSWISKAEGEKALTFEWPEEVTIGCLQFVNGWPYNGGWQGMLTNYRIEYDDGAGWNEVSTLDISDVANFGRDYHVFGLEWDEENIVFYLDGQEIRREKNEFAYSEAPIWLSLAIIKWDGPVTDAVDGTSMKVDWVRYYQRK
ncbi:MAG: family 16 glycosylhydrolase [Planctomycetota bacterium]